MFSVYHLLYAVDSFQRLAVTQSNGRVWKTPHEAGLGKNTGNGGYNATRNISAVRREADEICAVMGYYAAYNGSS
jgi:hypothetical protein